MRKLILILASCLVRLTALADHVPTLDEGYQAFCQFAGGEGHAGIHGCTQWSFTRGVIRVWFQNDQAQAIAMGSIKEAQ